MLEAAPGVEHFELDAELAEVEKTVSHREAAGGGGAPEWAEAAQSGQGGADLEDLRAGAGGDPEFAREFLSERLLKGATDLVGVLAF